jgi:hypothetical protein
VSATSILQNSTTGTTAINGGSITTSSTQEYRNNVTLGADATLSASTATFKGTITGAYGLAITGNAVFGDGTADTVTLTGSTGNLSVSGTTAINTSTITTSGTQTYTGAVTVNTALTLSASGITTGSTFAVSANALTFMTDAIALGGNLSGTAALVIQPKTATTTIGLAGAAGDLNLSAAELDLIQDGFSLITIGSASGTGKITAAAYTFKDTLKLINAGSSSNGGMQFTGAVSVLGGTSGTTNILTLNTAGTVTQDSGAGITAFGLELLGTGGTFTLTDTANAITTLAGNTGTVSFLENSGFAIGTVNTAGLTTTGNTTLSSAGTVTQSQKVAASGLELLGTGTFTLTNTGSANAISTLAINAGVVSYTQSGAYTVGVVGSTTGITTTGNLALVSTSGITLSKDVTSGAGTQTYTGPITLSTQAITLTSTDTTINFNGSTTTINGARDLIINSGSGLITFGGIVGGSTALTSITLQGTGANTLPSAITTTGAIDLKGTSRTSSLVVGTALSSTGAGDITIGSVNGAYSFQVGNSSGTIDIGIVGGSTVLSSLTFTGTGLNKLRGNITTSGAADLKGTSRSTQLFSDVTIATTNSNVTMGVIDGDVATAAGTYALNVNNGSGTITLGNVGVTKALRSVTLSGTGSTFVGTINTTNGYSLGATRGITLTVNTTYVNPNDPVVLGNVTYLTA